MALLIYKDDRGVERRQQMKGDRLAIGRLVENDLVLLDAQISRKHCIIEKRGDKFQITDLGSRFGTFVNDKPVQGTSAMAFGDRLRLGSVALTFSDESFVAPSLPTAEDTGSGSTLPASVGEQLATARKLAEQLLDYAKSPTSSPLPAVDAATALIGRIGVAQSALEDMERNSRLAHTLDAMGKLINNVTDLLRVLDSTLELAVGALGAERGYILLEVNGKLVPRVQKNMGDLRGISTSIAEQVVADGKNILTTDAQIDPRFMEAQSVMVHGIRAVMCVPLRYKDVKNVGAIYVDGRPGNRSFNSHGLSFLGVFASQAAIAIENARLAARNALEEERRTKLSRYFSPAVIGNIMAGGAPELANQGRIVTLLFSDIRGFTSLMEKLKPSDAVEMLNDYFTQIVDELEAEEGTLDKYTGDGLMAFWGAPNDQPDHALRAVRAALKMQARMPALSEKWAKDARPWAKTAVNMLTGIGIHTGEAVVGNMGSPKRIEYTAIGDAVNLSARVQGVAEGGQVLITASTLEMVKDAVHVESLPPANLKGKSAAVPIFRVIKLR